MTTKAKSRASKDHFLALVRRLPLRPIRSESDLDEALAMVDELLKIPPRRFTRDHEDYLESLSQLVEHYEAKHHRIELPDPIDFLQHLMKARDMTASDLGRLLGNRSLGSKVINRRRELSKANILTVARHFNVNPGLFLA